MNMMSKQYTDRREILFLSRPAIQSIIDLISAQQDGFLTISITADRDSPFVQVCTDHEGIYFVESNGRLAAIGSLGFSKAENDILPCKYVPENELINALIDTLQQAFAVRPGQLVEFNYEYVDR